VGCERLLGELDGGPAVECERGDLDGDGHAEVRVRTPDLAVTLRPERGGTVTELLAIRRDIDLADVLTRRREVYHARVKDRRPEPHEGEVRTIHAEPGAREDGLGARIEYDQFRRASFLDGLFPEGIALDALDPWPLAHLVIGERAMHSEVRQDGLGVTATLALDEPDGWPLGVRKSLRVPAAGPSLEVSYRLDWAGAEPLTGRWGVQLNLALTAGDAPGRYYRLPDRPSLGSRGRLEDQRQIAMVDEWLGCEVEVCWPAPAEVSWAPVETVSLSESGFERIYQGSALLVTWPVRLDGGARWEGHLRLTVR
jgi:alpha-amylase